MSGRWRLGIPVAEATEGAAFTVGVHFTDPAKVIWLSHGGGSYLTSPDYIITEATIVRITELESAGDLVNMGDDPAEAIHLFPVNPETPERTVRVTIKVQDRQFTAEVAPTHQIYLLPDHYERCGGCGEIWPCRDARIDSAAQRFTMELDDMCAHCGKPIKGAWSRQFDGRKFHIAKKYRHDGTLCREAAAAAWAEWQCKNEAEATR